MTRCQQDPSIRIVLPDDIGSSRRGQDSILPNDEVSDAICRADLEDRLNGLGTEVSTVAPDDVGRSVRLDGIKNGLNEIFGVVLGYDSIRDQERNCESTRPTPLVGRS